MALWAFAFPIADVLLDTWGALSLAFARQLIALLTLLIVWWHVEGNVALIAAPWWRGMFIGGLGFGVGAPLLLYGQSLSDPVTPALAAAMMPVAAALLEVLLDQRKMSFTLWAGITLALCGGLLASGARLSDSAFGLGTLLCLFSVFLFAWASRETTKKCHGVSAIGQATITLTGAALVLGVSTVIAVVMEFPGVAVGAFDLQSIVLLVFSGAVSLGISQLLWLWCVGKIGVFLASIHMNAVPFYVMVIMVSVLGSSWSWTQSFGVALVACGVLTTQLATSRRHLRV